MSIAVGLKMAVEQKENDPKIGLLAPIYPILQMLNFRTSSYRNEDFPTLTREQCVDVWLSYATGNASEALHSDAILGHLISLVAPRDNESCKDVLKRCYFKKDEAQ